MTAAALKPDLFTHLFASRRAHREKADVAATALSVVFHAGIVAALVWASVHAPAPAETLSAEPPIILVDPFEAPQARTDNGGSRGGDGRPSSGPSLTAPDFVPGFIPDPGQIQDKWYEPDSRGGSGLGNPGGVESAPPGSGMKDGFAVATVLPKLLNADAVRRELERSYPAFLRDAGIGGEVLVWLLIDENGRVVESEIKESSGHAALDQAAVAVGALMRFSPGRNRDHGVKVWVSVPIRFTTR